MLIFKYLLTFTDSTLMLNLCIHKIKLNKLISNIRSSVLVVFL